MVCFDLGGVVIRICRTFDEAVLNAGLPQLPPPDDSELLHARIALAAQHQLGAINGHEFRERVSDLSCGAYTGDDIGRIHAAVLLGEYDGIADTIRAIRHASLRTACLSNTNDDHWAALLAMPALQALDARHASHLWGLAKPDVAIYRRFERELGVSGSEILFFDDLLENVATARGIGWDAVLIDHAENTAQQVRAALTARGVQLR